MKNAAIRFNLDQVPFSRAGAYQSFSRLTTARWPFHQGSSQLVWRTLHGDGKGTLARLDVTRKGRPITFHEEATPQRLTLRARKGKDRVEISFIDSTTVSFRGFGLGLRLKTPLPGDYDQIQPDGPKAWRLNFCSRQAEFRFQPQRGTLRVSAPWDGVKCSAIRLDFIPARGSAEWEVTAQQMRWSPQPGKPIDLSWTDWLREMPKVPQALREARELAAYITWSALVDPHGHFQRPAMYMSKNWMTNVWSWDHCFNAIALARNQPSLAWDQLMIPFDVQTTGGQLPDFVNDGGMLWNFVKPPIHGWALGELMKRTSWIGKKEIGEIYPKLVAWTEWWFRERDSDGDGLPQYNHGNDSGWDNATCFKVGMPVEGPDLAAFLILQLDTLAALAGRLGKSDASRLWSRRADALLEKMISHFWRKDHFMATRSGDHAVHASDSLIPFIPLVLGGRLPKEIATHLLAGLREEGRFLTAHGLATESPRSPQYEPDGYWRGPIWAPPVFLIISGLEKMGEHRLAGEIAKRFCRTCARSGMAENFNALTGQGLRDGAYTWTASIFLLLASEWPTRKARACKKPVLS